MNQPCKPVRRNLQKRVLVTGGAGFLGSHLCENLLARGHDVVCLDNFSTGTRTNVSNLLSNPRFSLLEHDVTLSANIEADEIYNLACPASPVHYQRDPVQTLRTCVLGALNMLTLARQVNARILQASTSEIYGNPEVHPQHEGYWGHVNPIGPRACYDEGKRCAETLFFDHRRQYGLRTKVVRIFNTYGPRMQPDDGRVVSNFVMQALQNRPLTLYGDGCQTRSFCYVTDLVNGLVRMMEADDRVAGPVNLGNPIEITIRDLAETIIDLTGSSSMLEFRSLPQDDPVQRRPEIILAREQLNWQPRVALTQGLLKTIRYFERTLTRDGTMDRLAI